MTRKVFTILSLLMIVRISLSQGIEDRVIPIEGVTINAERIFRKKEAGMKETKVDSVILLEKFNLSLSDVLAENTTVYIKNYGRGALATASFRGTAPTHTSVAWNGLNINSPMLGMVDFSLIPVYIIDDLSLQHGAASIKESSGGLGGHISLNNTVDWNNRFSARYFQGIGSYSSFDEFGQVNLGNHNIQSKTRFYHNDSKNDYKILNTNRKDTIKGIFKFPVTKNKDANYQKWGAVQELYFKPASRVFTSLKAWYQDAQRSIPNVLSYEGSDTTYRKNHQSDQTLKMVVEGKYYGENYSVKVNTGIDYQKLDYILRIRNSGLEELKPVNSGSTMFSHYNNARVELDMTNAISFKFNADANFFTISTLDSSSNTGYNEKRGEYSVFGGVYINLLKKINLLAELRKDWIPIITTPLVYNLGMSYKPLEQQDIELKASLARNLHNPGLNDLYWQPGGNPNLRPEEGHTVEAGAHYLQSSGPVELDVEITGYYSDINNWILWLPGNKGYWEAS